VLTSSTWQEQNTTNKVRISKPWALNFVYVPFVFFHARKVSSNTRRFHQLDLHYALQKITFLLQGDTEYPDAVNT
jgi:hypothetical protein